MCGQIHHQGQVYSGLRTLAGFITNYLERTAGVLSTCKDVGDMKLAKGVPYEAHKISQGCDNKKQYVFLKDLLRSLIYAPSTVVNHNGRQFFRLQMESPLLSI